MTPVLEARVVPAVVVALAVVVAAAQVVVVVPDIVVVVKSAVAVSAYLLVVVGYKMDPGNIPASAVVVAAVVDPNRPVAGHLTGAAVAAAPFEAGVTFGRSAVVVAQKGIVVVQDRRPQLDLLSEDP